MQYLFFLCIISYTVTPGNLKSYYIQPERTIEYKSNFKHYDQEYDFPEADPLFRPPPRTIDRIPVGDLKQRRCRRGRQSGLLVRLRRRAHCSPLPSILLANVQSLDNKFEQGLPSNFLSFAETWPTRDMLTESVQPTRFLHASRRQKQTSLW